MEEKDGRGYYLIQNEGFAKYLGINAPLNWNAVMGNVLLALYDATGRNKYKEQAKALARSLKAELKITKDKAYCWHYWFGRGYKFSRSTEDVSHGSLDVEFAVGCYEHGIVFNVEDVLRFANTLRKKHLEWGRLHFQCLRYGGINPAIADAAILWIPLGKYDREVYRLIVEYISEKDFSKIPEYKWIRYMLAVSEVIFIKSRFRMYDER